LEGFYFPQSGAVLVDGHDLRELDGSWWRQQVGIVRQEPVLFHCSIADNIRFSSPTATDAQIREACRVANAHDFIMSFPEGYNTQVGERGVRLSGGQKQRIAIARAVVADPAICIFDEASSALDAESEHLVHAALDRLMEGRTVLVIAHRLSTVRNADVVVVVNAGQVAATGTHDELLASSDMYAQLVSRQLSGSATFEGK
jgi:ATP-binding cassette subfamily B protein